MCRSPIELSDEQKRIIKLMYDDSCGVEKVPDDSDKVGDFFDYMELLASESHYMSVQSYENLQNGLEELEESISKKVKTWHRL